MRRETENGRVTLRSQPSLGAFLFFFQRRLSYIQSDNEIRKVLIQRGEREQYYKEFH